VRECTATTDELTYLHGDHLGSASLATDASGAKLTGSDTRYFPYGAMRPGLAGATLPTDRRYTGQRWEDGIGLYDYNARYYDPTLGRFISADTLVPNPGDPQSLNRYTYTLNNPLKYTDPSGHYAFEENPHDPWTQGPMSQKPHPGVNFVGDWPEPYRAVVEAGARTVGGALAGVMRQENYLLYKSGDSPNRGPRITSRGAFLQVFGRITFRQVAASTVDGWAWARVAERGEIWVGAVGDLAYLRWGSQNTAHELGHAFAQLIGGQPYNDLNTT